MEIIFTFFRETKKSVKFTVLKNLRCMVYHLEYEGAILKKIYNSRFAIKGMGIIIVTCSCNVAK